MSLGAEMAGDRISGRGWIGGAVAGDRRIRPSLAAVPLLLLAACASAGEGGGAAATDATVAQTTAGAGEVGSPAAPPRREVVDLSRHFAAAGAEGAFVLYDLAENRLLVHDPAGARERHLPASTFKILNSLIALETGVLADEHEVVPWDGVDRGDWWNGDQAMTRAFQRSTVWFYQEVARRVGEERMAEWVRRSGYGNMDTGGELDRFWLEGDLRISAEEQVQLLRRVYFGELPFSERSHAIVRRVMRMEEGDGWSLSGKTGWTRVTEGDTLRHVGWLVGWVEREGRTFFFATRIGSLRRDFPMRQAQQEITRGALRELGVLP